MTFTVLVKKKGYKENFGSVFVHFISLILLHDESGENQQLMICTINYLVNGKHSKQLMMNRTKNLHNARMQMIHKFFLV